MEANAIGIRNIAQKSNYTFTIEWSDGKLLEYRLSALQKHCPCASCTDEKSGKKPVDEGVRAKRIVSVGQYALRIEFTSGCSMGIYDYDLLRSGDFCL